MSAEPNAASVAIFRGNEVLLIKRARAPFAGFWTLPGGRLEAGESIMQCAQREVREELGLRLEGMVAATTMASGAAFVLMIYAARMPDETVAPSPEIADWLWTAAESIDHLQTTPGLKAVLAMAQGSLAACAP